MTVFHNLTITAKTHILSMIDRIVEAIVFIIKLIKEDIWKDSVDQGKSIEQDKNSFNNKEKSHRN